MADTQEEAQQHLKEVAHEVRGATSRGAADAAEERERAASARKGALFLAAVVVAYVL